MLVQCMRKFFPCLLERLAQGVNFEHLRVPLRLQEGKRRREAHRFEGFGRCVAGNFKVNEVLDFQGLACKWALTCHCELFEDQALLKHVSVKKS